MSKSKNFIMSGIFATLVSIIMGIFLSLWVCSSEAAGGKFPERPINLIVPTSPGGPIDLAARVIATQAKLFFGVPVVVINMPGGGNTIGVKHVKASAPDGYNLLITNSGVSCAYHLGSSDINFDALQQVCRLTIGNEALASHVDSQWEDMKGFLEYTRKNPEKVKYGATPASTSQYVMANIEQTANVKFLFVPYQGGGPRMTALAGRHIDIISTQVQGALQYVKAGKWRILGVFKTQRSSVYPDLPTTIEKGLNVTDTYELIGLYAPKETPKDIIIFLDLTFKKILESQGCIDGLAKVGQEPSYLDAENYMKYLSDQDKEIERLSKRLHLKK